MNYAVCIKQVPDTTTRFQLKDEGRGVDLSHVKWIISPYDEMALEEALRLAEKDALEKQDSKVLVFSLGPARVKSALLTALAMGADSAFHAETTEPVLDSLESAEALYQTFKQELENIDIIFCGKHSLDSGQSAFSSMLAALLKYPNVHHVHQITAGVQSGDFKLYRNLDSAREEEITIKKPFVAGAAKGDNQPRLPSLPGLMKAKTKPMTVKKAEAIKEQNRVSIESFELPAERPPVEMIKGSPEEQARCLAQILKTKGLI